VLESFKETAPGKRNPRYKRDRLRWDAPAKTIRAQGKLKANGSGQRNSSHQSIHPSEHRQITVREAARIQTFPDWYVFDRTFVNGYRVVGDAVPPALAAVLGQAVRSELESVDVGSTLAAAA
jgi:DNA (cytosine-5)-methyltransferase 1